MMLRSKKHPTSVKFYFSIFMFLQHLCMVEMECPKNITGIIETDHSKVDKSKGQTFISSDPDYAFICCGVIRQWKALFVAEGYIRFQVWRRNMLLRTRTYELVGQNLYHVKKGDVGKVSSFDIHPHRRISVSPDDVIGWQAVGKELIPYKYHDTSIRGRGFWAESVGIVTSGDMVKVGEGKFLHHRKYILAAQTEKNQKPYFLTDSGLDKVQVYINDTYTAGALVYEVKVSDNDTYDEHLLVIAMTTKSSVFTFQDHTRSVRLRRPPKKGEYKLNLAVKDQCHDMTTLTLHITVIESHPVSPERQGKPAIVYIVGVTISMVIVIATFLVVCLYTFNKLNKAKRVRHGSRRITVSKH